MSGAPPGLWGLFGALLCLAALEMLRRRRLGEENALPWVLFGATMALLALLAPPPQAGQGAALPLAAAVLLLTAAGLHLSVQVSKLRRQVKTLAQKLSLLEGRAGKGDGKGVAKREGPEGPPSRP